ncbi:MAG: ABC transporter permease [Pseudomonas sp.]|uniref:ABC transporter permease n=1 Tax=Pseudomonas abieticivorans TaxID=2931382 RepID=UPI0020BF9195|nr:ABC transporter permease [Pseudomonas sp. PIA16]MDE1166625.1 ABC transporter permease [Pseudomonas sp.]
MATNLHSRPLLARESAQRVIIPAVIALLLVLAWQVALVALKVPSYLIPTPWLTLTTLVQDWNVLGPALLFTLKITLMSFALSVLIGVAIAFVFVQSRMIEVAFFPYAVLLQVTPIVAIAPLIIIWVRDTTLAMVVCSTLMAVFPIISNTALGLRSVSPGLLAYFKLRRSSRLQVLMRLRVPTALPYFFAALRISCGLALIGAVVAEFVAGTGGANTGLAYQILQAGFQLNIPRMFAALLLISLAGIALFAGMSLLSQKAIGHWHDSEAQRDQ